MINILIIEDIEENAVVLKKIILSKNKLFPFIREIEIVGDIDGAKLLLETNPLKYTLIFWDIMLGGKDSLVLATHFPKDAMIIVFSSYPEYIHNVLNDYDNLTSQIQSISPEQKKKLLSIDVFDEENNEMHIDKSIVSQISEQNKISRFLLKAEKKYGQKLSLRLFNDAPLKVSPLEISFVMNFDDTYLSLNSKNQDLLENRKIIFTEHVVYITKADTQAKIALKNYLGLINIYDYFAQVNQNCIINTFNIVGFRKKSGFRRMCIEMDCMPTQHTIPFYTDGSSHVEQKQKSEEGIHASNFYPHYELSTKIDFNLVELTDTYKDRFIEKLNKYRTDLEYIG